MNVLTDVELFPLLVVALRVLVYLWVALTAFSIAQLYKDGLSYTTKQSPIINSLINILVWMAVVFLYYALIAIAQVLNKEIYAFLISLLPISVLPLGILLTIFRQDSVKEKRDNEERNTRNIGDKLKRRKVN